MDKSSIELREYLSEHFVGSQHRLGFIARFVLSLIKVKTVNLTQIALGLNSQAKAASNYRRIQRFFAEFSFDKAAFVGWIVQHLPRESWVLCLDRTNWKLGTFNINILAIGVAYRGTAIGLLWQLLPKCGNSNQGERIALIQQLLACLPKKNIKAVIADREFIGQDWFSFLTKQNIKFHIRLRDNILAELAAANEAQGQTNSQAIRLLFRHLKSGETLTLHQRYYVCGQLLAVTGMRLADDELLIIVTNGNPKQSLDFYAQRWEIEMLFSALKTTGFDLETTHLNQTQRIDTLLLLLMLALVWSHTIGETLHTTVKPIKRKKHGRLAQSFFRYGLDFFRAVLLNLPSKFPDFRWALSLLSCT